MLRFPVYLLYKLNQSMWLFPVYLIYHTSLTCPCDYFRFDLYVHFTVDLSITKNIKCSYWPECKFQSLIPICLLPIRINLSLVHSFRIIAPAACGDGSFSVLVSFFGVVPTFVSRQSYFNGTLRNWLNALPHHLMERSSIGLCIAPSLILNLMLI